MNILMMLIENVISTSQMCDTKSKLQTEFRECVCIIVCKKLGGRQICDVEMNINRISIAPGILIKCNFE